MNGPYLLAVEPRVGWFSKHVPKWSLVPTHHLVVGRSSEEEVGLILGYVMGVCVELALQSAWWKFAPPELENLSTAGHLILTPVEETRWVPHHVSSKCGRMVNPAEGSQAKWQREGAAQQDRTKSQAHDKGSTCSK